jgi:hypothetical protein
MSLINTIPTRHQLRTWDALVEKIKSRLKSKNYNNILYGDLSEKLFGARNKGGQSFSRSLGEIHSRTDKYNRLNGSTHPPLNALVFNQRGKQPGIPKYVDPRKIWPILESEGPGYLVKLGILLGFHDFKSGKPRQGPPTQSHGDNSGAKRGGERSGAVWRAVHSPIVKLVADALDELQSTSVSGAPWQPDLVRRMPNGSTLIIEVKPDCGLHNIITAIGQSVCYRSGFNDVISIIAAPGVSTMKSHVRSVLDEHDIRLIDLDSKVISQIVSILGTPSVRRAKTKDRS